MNSVNLIGNLGNDPEVKYLNNEKGTCICDFNIAVSRYVNKEEKSNWIKCKAIGKTAENIGEYFKKGNKIGLTGEIVTDNWEKDGQKHSLTYVLINKFDFLTSKKAATEEKEKEIVNEDEIPF